MKVAIIGNGPLDNDHSTLIDSCEVVIRINRVTAYGGNYGTKLDVLALVNTGIEAPKVMDPRLNPFITQARDIWLTRNPLLYSQIGDSFAGKPAAQFFAEHSRIVHGPLYKGLNVKAVDYEVGLALINKIPEFSTEPFIMPSTGMRVIEEVVRNAIILGCIVPVERIYIAGFSHEGWPGHPWQAERAIIDSYVAEGRVIRLV